jgi:hypothetical protein
MRAKTVLLRFSPRKRRRIISFWHITPRHFSDPGMRPLTEIRGHDVVHYKSRLSSPVLGLLSPDIVLPFVRHFP